jgi:hypothetical protein
MIKNYSLYSNLVIKFQWNCILDLFFHVYDFQHVLCRTIHNYQTDKSLDFLCFGIVYCYQVMFQKIIHKKECKRSSLLIKHSFYKFYTEPSTSLPLCRCLIIVTLYFYLVNAFSSSLFLHTKILMVHCSS